MRKVFPHILRQPISKMREERVNVMTCSRELQRHYKLIILRSRIHEARLRHG